MNLCDLSIDRPFRFGHNLFLCFENDRAVKIGAVMRARVRNKLADLYVNIFLMEAAARDTNRRRTMFDSQ